MAKKNSKAPKKGMIFNSVSMINTNNVVSYVNSLPRRIMSEDAFNAYMLKNFYFGGRFHGQDFNGNSHYSTVVRQLGLYQIKNNCFIPRFYKKIDSNIANAYLKYWLKLYVIPNPTSLPGLRKNISSPKYVLKEIILYIIKNPTIKNIYDIVDNTFGIEFSRSDKGNLPSILSNYSECISIDTNNNATLQPNYTKVMEEIENLINDPNRYFEHYGNGGDFVITDTNYLQCIYYGAPGTGKSNEIKLLTGEGKDGFKFSKDYTFRTTFHPDSDYSTFVGAYKPIWSKEEKKIVYDFRPQTFLKAYIAAWTHPGDNVALVIEEINRGNCAQIFGDIFQLLDRERNGLSKYPIEADIDMQRFLARAFSGELEEKWAGCIGEHEKDEINAYYEKHYDDAFEKIKNGEILALPKNLSLLATMNTSDQSLFPMDSAFKRRWEWIYQPIVDAEKGWKIEVGNKYELVDWWEFVQRINKIIATLTTSEDKQLGYFFCIPDEYKEKDETKRAADAEPDLISAKNFVGKVLFYLWNDVFKDFAFDEDCCKDSEGKEVLYAQFYKDSRTINEDALVQFFNQLTKDKEKPLLVKRPETPTPAETAAETIDAAAVPISDDESRVDDSNTEA